jgi:hypothetical protein
MQRPQWAKKSSGLAGGRKRPVWYPTLRSVSGWLNLDPPRTLTKKKKKEPSRFQEKLIFNSPRSFGLPKRQQKQKQQKKKEEEKWWSFLPPISFSFLFLSIWHDTPILISVFFLFFRRHPVRGDSPRTKSVCADMGLVLRD